jgi:hypothetical protein
MNSIWYTNQTKKPYSKRYKTGTQNTWFNRFSGSVLSKSAASVLFWFEVWVWVRYPTNPGFSGISLGMVPNKIALGTLAKNQVFLFGFGWVNFISYSKQNREKHYSF